MKPYKCSNGKCGGYDCAKCTPGCASDSLCDLCGKRCDNPTETYCGDLVCEFCLDSDYEKCSVCGDWCIPEDVRNVNDAMVCDNCKEK